ncbi:peptidoglycan DD-metalloendopeptidase family protein [Fournierella massiliensis]|uniref:Peptidoglycan DD-metalloendopeptidase family protein n=1 Tax=Allofournierella massiliensis TaxID=1650663 RepID=A0ABT7UM69_9FIRM|nr:peptidoglycan DD-metalloendopeptidase family protein [Fournierella massiliensis]
MAQCVENKTPNGRKNGRERWLRLRAAAVRLAKRLRFGRGAAVLGQFLYDVGFWGEYTARRLVRGSWTACCFLGRRCVLVWKRASGLVTGALKTGVQDMTAPFTRMASGAKNIRAHVQEEKQAGTAHAAKEGLRYFALGVRRYFPLLGRAAAYVLPVAALAVFGYTVHTVLEYNYVLAVEVNGSVVGYVQTEQVFDSAREEVAQRINYAGAGEESWTVEPSYQIAVGEQVLDENQMADAILQSSSNEIQNATGLYVNGELVAVTTEGDRLRQELDSMTAPYEDPDNPNLTVAFNKEVRCEDSIYFTSTLVPVEQIIEKLHGEEQGAVYYTIQDGDTPWTVAGSFGISVDELQAQNPDRDFSSSSGFPVGGQLTISQAMPYLQVKRTLVSTYQESIPYDTEEQQDPTLPMGTVQVVQEGAEGVAEITQQQVFYGDSDTPSETTVIDRVVVQQPVTRIVAMGQYVPAENIAYLSDGSTLIWPVPAYRGISRWMLGAGGKIHGGVDIRANYGTEILASASGQVTVAGYHWSYGNYVVINHGNGYQTLYAHASSLAVRAGQSVTQGQVIAYVGSTGKSSGNHCHFEIRLNGARQQPRDFFPNK